MRGLVRRIRPRRSLRGGRRVFFRRAAFSFGIQDPVDYLTIPLFVLTGFVAALFARTRRNALERAQEETQQRRDAESRLTEAQHQLAQELDAMRAMHELSGRLMKLKNLKPLLSGILDTALSISGAAKGNIQLLDGQRNLRIEAQRGFSQEFLDFFNTVQDHEAACGTVMARGERIIVEDVVKSPLFSEPARETMLRDGARAVRSTPMISGNGAVIGMLSTHYPEPRLPSERDLRLIDLLARQAADLIERNRARATRGDARPATDARNGCHGVDAMQPRPAIHFLPCRLCRDRGVPAEQIAGRPIAEVVGEEGFEVIRPYVERVLRGECVEYETQLPWAAAGAKWIRVYLHALARSR